MAFSLVGAGAEWSWLPGSAGGVVSELELDLHLNPVAVVF